MKFLTIIKIYLTLFKVNKLELLGAKFIRENVFFSLAKNNILAVVKCFLAYSIVNPKYR